MKNIKVTFTNGDHLITRINADEAFIAEYYKEGTKTTYWNGGTEEKTRIISKVEIL